MKISFILPDVKGGGAQKMIINLANFYAQKGDNINLVLFKKEGPYQNLIDKKVNIINFNKSRSLFVINILRKYLKKEQKHTIISSMYYVNVICLFCNLLNSKKHNMIITERNHFTHRIKAESILHQITFKTLIKKLYPTAHHIVGISNGVCHDLKGILGNIAPISTIYNPVISVDYKHKIAENNDNIYPKNIDIKLITSGRLVAQKDYPTLLKALSYYQKNYNNSFHLVILGDGHLKNKIKSTIDDMNLTNHISFLGFVENPLSYMKQADIFILSSAWEGFGNVLVEALYCGLKIISTNCPSGPAEILVDGKYGILTPVGDKTALAKAINESYKSKIFSQEQKNRALDFTVDNIANHFELIINKDA